MVVLQHLHVPYVGNLGSIGVITFFVLSGFLITSLLVRERTLHGSNHLRHFYARRCLRLMPALFAALIVVMVYALVVAPPHLERDLLREVVFAGLYVYNFAAELGVKGRWLYHTWSLSLEEQFYLVWPPVMIFMTSRGRLQSLARGVGVAIVAIIVARVIGFSGPLKFLYECPDALLVGCFAALMVGGRFDGSGKFERAATRVGEAGAVVWLAIVATSIAFAVSGAHRKAFAPQFVRFLAPILIVGAVALVVGLVRGSSRWCVVLEGRILTAIGRRAYGIYLWHVVAFEYVDTIRTGTWSTPMVWALKLVLSGLLVTVSYEMIEKRAVELKRRFAR